MNGGYINIDASGLDIHETEKQTISGIYKKVKNAMLKNKPLFVYNAVFGSYGKMSPIAIMANYASDGVTIICTSSTIQLIVSADDGVITNNLVSE